MKILLIILLITPFVRYVRSIISQINDYPLDNRIVIVISIIYITIIGISGEILIFLENETIRVMGIIIYLIALTIMAILKWMAMNPRFSKVLKKQDDEPWFLV